MKLPERRCGNCTHFPGNGRVCSWNTWTGGAWHEVKAWNYGCMKFEKKGTSRWL